MSLVKSKGNMYDWVTHMHSHLAGACSHGCSYCYVQMGPAGRTGKYAGPTWVVEKEFGINYGPGGRVIFIEHMNDLFAYPGVNDTAIGLILQHTRYYPGNEYVFQTKNPARAWNYRHLLPQFYTLGTTIETNRDLSAISHAPPPAARAAGLALFAGRGKRTFITVEPIMDFDTVEFAGLIREAEPSFVNIGADSKGCGLPEPSWEKVAELIKRLSGAGIEIREKHNLERLSRRLP